MAHNAFFGAIVKTGMALELIRCGLVLAVFAVSVQAQAGHFRVVTISTEPNAVVWLDGVRFGKTDPAGTLEIKTVSTGAHQLRVRADGFKEKTLTITGAQRGDLSIPLVKTTDEAELAFQEAERLASLDREKQVEAYRRAVRMRPNYPEAYVAMARTLAEMGELEEAAKAIAQARKYRPGYAEASAVLARIYKDGGDEEKAIATFKRAITEGKGFQPEAYAGLGLLYKERAEAAGASGQFEKEEAAYGESAKHLKSSLKQLSGAPDAVVIYQLLGLIYERQKRWSDAVATYEEFLQIFPDTVEATAVRSFIVQIKKEMSLSQQ
jgi:tetratricopeptide (TPR) repeat protein